MPAAFTKQFTMQLAEVIRAAREGSGEQRNAVSRERSTCAPARTICDFPSAERSRSIPATRIEGYRPCADVAFETVAAYARAMAVGVVLTGMGNDAAKGVKMVKAAGGYVLAQDEATSVIFGMPAEAIQTGVVDEVLPLAIISAVGGSMSVDSAGVTEVSM